MPELLICPQAIDKFDTSKTIPTAIRKDKADNTKSSAINPHVYLSLNRMIQFRQKKKIIENFNPWAK